MTTHGKSVHWWQVLRAHTMLVLSRKKDESIVINNDITIVVVEIRGDKVRLGIEAPKEVPVHRQEVFQSIVDVPLTESLPGTESARITPAVANIEGSTIAVDSVTSGAGDASDTATGTSAVASQPTHVQLPSVAPDSTGLQTPGLQRVDPDAQEASEPKKPRVRPR